MRLGDLAGKEIINICDGERLGIVGNSDLVIDENTGKIEAILVPQDRGFWGFSEAKKMLTIPWHAIKKIGAEILVVDLEEDYMKKYKHKYLEI
ncbi:MAG TPA: YlmC/YmxH family sporulation protein [Clostridia bacterium]|nr:YlmC/YmxH family sporulation protein [Clostridia bacterium]